jgi:hypothetical protein
VIAVAARAVVAGLVLVERHRHTDVVPTDVWARLLTEVEAHVDRGTGDPCDVAVGVCLHGPPAVRSAARAAVRDQGDASPGVLLGMLCERLRTAQGDRMCATVAVIAGGVGDVTLLARLRDREAALADARRTARAVARGGAAGCWLLLTPLALVATGRLSGVAAWATSVAAVAGWWAGRAWLRTTVAGPRVFTGRGVRALVVPDRMAARP